MKNTFVIQTDDPNFQSAIDQFLHDHCQTYGLTAVVYEMDDIGGAEVMAVINKD